jgi:hypothetical protein
MRVAGAGLKFGPPDKIIIWRHLKPIIYTFFLIGQGWKKFRSFEPKFQETFGEILLRVTDYYTDVIVPLIDWRPSSSPTDS